MLYSREHVVVVSSVEGRARLTISPFLRQHLGAPLHLRFRPVGSRVEAGASLGVAEGPLRACHLYAPFALIISSSTDEAVDVEVPDAHRAELLDEAAYQAHTQNLAALLRTAAP